MTDKTIEASDESRISRRNALKAAAAAGVGAMAWTGPQITAFGATPAYAAACTAFTVDEYIDGRNTNQGNNRNCSSAAFTYQADPFGGQLPAATGGKVSWNWATGGPNTQVCPGTTVTLTINDSELTCWVELWLYQSASGFDDYYAYHLFGPSTGTVPVLLPDGTDPGDDPTPPGEPHFPNTNFAIQVRCIDKDRTECFPQFPT
jgi:hypothetical protein